MTLVLHGYFRSSAAYRVRIALNLKGLAYEQRSVHLRRGEQRDPSFLELNPLGLVPVLVDGSRVLSQSLAILEYLDEAYPGEPRLLPPEIAARARVRALAEAVACDIHPINNLRVLRYVTGQLGQSQDAMVAWYNHWIAEGFRGLEAMLAKSAETGRFCHGDTPGLADCCLVPQVVNAARHDLDMRPYPTIRRIYETCQLLPAFVEAQPARQPDAE